MPEQYSQFPTIFSSKGIIARNVDDQIPAGFFLSLDSMEEIEENGLAVRLGTSIVNKSGTAVNALPGTVYSLQKLSGLGNTAYRYAGSAGALFRRQGLTTGPYAQIASGMSGNPWISVIQDPVSTSYPYIFIADANGMLKDNGTLAAPQQMGIFQPQYPAFAQAQAPYQINLDTYPAPSTRYTYTGISGGTIGSYVNTTTTSGVAAGIQTVNVAAPAQIGLFQLLTIGTGASQETVLVIALVGSGFTAKFTKTHATGTLVTNNSISVTVPASTTAAVSLNFGGNPIGTWPTTLEQEDYIGLYLYVSDPAQIQSITLSFGVANDTTFQSDYFYKVIGQGPLQSLLNTATNTTNSSVAAADVITADALGIFQTGDAGITPLNTGLNQWTPILVQLGDFAGAGRADFNDPTYNWYNVNGYQLQIVTNDNASVTVQMSSLVLFGGFGPDSFGGVSYDYVWTFYNINDGTESNPSMFMTNVNPPTTTYWVTPRRQGVLVTMTYPKLDPQTTHLRIYRRGGGLGDNFRRIDQIPITASPQTYLDIWTDDQISGGDFVSLTNDVPVTSSLVVPVNTTLNAPVGIGLQSLTPASMANISVSQQINLGNVVADNYETVVVLAVTGVSFTAYVQNTHLAGETVAATAAYGQPVTIMATAFDQMYFAGDPNNPNFLYYGPKGNPQVVGSASYVPVGTPDDTITAIVATRSNLFVSTLKRWWAVAPGTNPGSPPTVYPTSADRGCIALQGVCVKGEDVFYCMPEDEAEILTKTGWKHRRELQIGEEVLGYDIATKTTQWTKVEHINVFDYDGDLIRLQGGRTGTRFDFSCTPDHKWAHRPEKRTKPYAQHSSKANKWPHHYDTCKCGNRKSRKALACRECGYGREEQLKLTKDLSMAGVIVQAAPLCATQSILTPREAAILGWIVTDGSIPKNGRKRRSARVHQASHSKFIDTLKDLLGGDVTSISKVNITKGYGEKYGKVVEEWNFLISTDFTEYLLSKCKYKSKDDLPGIVCQLDLNSSAAMFQAMMDGDGSHARSRTGRGFSQLKGPVMEALRLLALFCGKATTNPQYKKISGYSRESGRTSVCSKGTIDCQGIRKSTRNFVGKVWCPTTGLGTWVARSNGTISITGNCSLDGIRIFKGGNSEYATQQIEFIWQGIGKTPIVKADTTQLSRTVMTFWNNMVFISYVGVDGNRHRLIWHTIYQRWRNDDLDTQSILLEADTNTLLFGDSQGLIHQDRQNTSYDEANFGGQVIQAPISINMQTPYDDQRNPTVQKNYNNVVIDANTNGATIAVTISFNDGQSGITVGTVNTTKRQKTNLNINAGQGFQAYKASLQITGSVSERVELFQAAIEAIPLAVTRQSWDSYWSDNGLPESKFCRDSYWDYNATGPITVTVYYDESVTIPPFVFTLPEYNGIRNSFRQRMPAVKYRLIRIVLDSQGQDFQLWNTSKLLVKGVKQGSGYDAIPLLSLEK